MSTRSDQRKDAAEHGLYDPAYEHDACGVGFVASVKGQASHEIVTQALQILKNLDHRGAVGADPLCGDGAGILIRFRMPSSAPKWPSRIFFCLRQATMASA